MKIGLIAVDSNYPNLALMKLSAYHKAHGDHVSWYSPWERYDKVYMAKVFNFTEDYDEVINADDVVRGGTGYDIHSVLPDEMDMLQPDYSIYPQIDRRTAYGFLTRGCPNKCPWCVVPAKEGKIRPYMDVEQIASGGRTHLILMDNNILASSYGIEQIEKIVKFDTAFYWWVPVAAFAVVAAVSLLSVWLISRKAVRENPVENLKTE